MGFRARINPILCAPAPCLGTPPPPRPPPPFFWPPPPPPVAHTIAQCMQCSPRIPDSKAFALTWYFSPGRPVAALDVPLLVTRQQGSPSPACRQLSRARNACAGGSSEHGTKLKARYQVRANALLYHTILAMAISCKCQGGEGTGRYPDGR